MRGKISTLLMAGIMVLASGCQENGFDFSETKARIVPVVSSVTTTKSAENVPAVSKHIATYTLSDDPESPLYLHVYEKDIDDSFAGFQTKGGEVTTDNITSFKMKAYATAAWYEYSSSGSKQSHVAGEYFPAIDVTREDTSSSDWSTSPVEYWPNEVKLRFWSWKGTAPSFPLTLWDDAKYEDYTVSTTVADQEDLIVAYNDEIRKFNDRGEIQDGKNDEVNIHFYHALAMVKFDVSLVEDFSVSNITLNNIFSKGDCSITTYSGYPDFDWTAVNLENPTSYSVDDPDQVFFLLPQSLAATGSKAAASMSVTFTPDGGSALAPVTKSIDKNGTETVVWRAGKYYIYKLSKTADDFTYTLSFDPDNEVILTSHLFDNNSSFDMTSAFDIYSKKINNGTGDVVDDKYPWNIKSYRVGYLGDEIPVDGDSFTAGTAWLSSSVNLSGGKLSVTATKSSHSNKGSNAYWTGSNGDWSPAVWSGDAIDLSMMDYTKDERSQSVNCHQMTTANCYIIRHAGSYKLPLVYGNAMVNGKANEQSYYPGATVGADRLVNFKNHRDEDIHSPFIENHQGCGGENLRCAIIWQETGVISNLSIVGTLKTVDASDPSTYYTKSDVRYLQFEVNQNSICQNNALICIYDDLYDDGTGSARPGYGDGQYTEGECIWSWHIWTFNDPILLADPIDVTNFTGDAVYGFFPTYNMGVIETDVYDERDDIYITLQQAAPSTNTIEVVLEQYEFVAETRGVTFNWGRKDPFPNDDALMHFDPNGSVSLGKSIRNPNTYFYSSSSIGGINWCDQLYYNLWTGRKCAIGIYAQDDDVIKTIYDPSPVMYKVPVIDAFSSFEIMQAGSGGDDKTKWNVVSTESNNTGYQFYTSLKLNSGEPGGPAVNDGGPTIAFPFNGLRYGGSNGGKIQRVNSQGWYYSVNYGSNPYLLIIENTSIACKITASIGNAHCVRPVIDPTAPVPTASITINSEDWHTGGGNINL